MTTPAQHPPAAALAAGLGAGLGAAPGAAPDERPEPGSAIPTPDFMGEMTPLQVFLTQLQARDDFPAFVRNVETITDVVHDPKARVQLLNDAIVGDIALSAKVLKIANSAIYAAAGRTVDTCYQAIMLLGFERMKDIAVGAAVFEHLKHRSPALRELMACSLLTANQSAVLSAKANYARPEVAYLCGIFRNLGELVCACYKPKEYGEYRQMPMGEDDPGAMAERQTFGFRFDELGQAIAEMWGLPVAISNAMYRPPQIGQSRADGPGTLAAITQLSSDLTAAVYRSPRWMQRGRLKNAIEAYGEAFGFSEEDLLNSARTALNESAGALKSAQQGFDPAMFEERLSAVEELVLGPPEGMESGDVVDADGRKRVAAPKNTIRIVGEAGGTPTGSGWVIGGAEPEIPQPTETDFVDVASALKFAVNGPRPLGTDEAVARTLAAMLSVGFQRAALLLGADGYTRMRVRTALGEGHEYLGDRLNINLQPPNGAIALSLLKREDVFSDLKANSPFRVDPSIKRLRSASFTIMPVIVGGQPIGALFADSLRRPMDYTPVMKESLIEVRDSLNQALDRLRLLAAGAAKTGT